MDERIITLHAFCSGKGGVGKSTLAVACAAVLAENGRRPLVIDADLTGTSLADGLSLRAPRLPLETRDDSLQLDALPSNVFYSLEETWELIERRRLLEDVDPERPCFVPFFNDALTWQSPDLEHDCRLDAISWQHQAEPRVRYLPSSPAAADIGVALGYMYTEGHGGWPRRLTWLLHNSLQQMPELTDIVIDLPPGLFGFTHATLSILSYLAREQPLPEGYAPLGEMGVRWRVKPFLITSQDRNDLYSVLRFLGPLKAQLPPLTPLVNRLDTSLNRIKEGAARRFPELESLGLLDLLIEVKYARTLSRIFVDGQLELTSDVRQNVEAALGLARME